LRISFWKNDYEFLTAITGYHISGPIQRIAQDACQPYQAVVAMLMAIGIIESLKKVRIDHYQGKRCTRAASAPPFEIESLLEVTAIRDTGQSVQVGQTEQMFILLLKLLYTLLCDLQSVFHEPDAFLLPPPCLLDAIATRHDEEQNKTR
jgi:hypothetical protein